MPPRSSFDNPSLCKHSVSLAISTRRSNVTIVSRLIPNFINFTYKLKSFIFSHPSLENELSIATPFDAPNAKKGNEHILLICIVCRRCSLRRIKLRSAVNYKKKRIYNIICKLVPLLLIRHLQLVELCRVSFL